MTFLLVAIAAFSAVNPARLVAAVPPGEAMGIRVYTASLALSGAVLLALAGFSGPLIDAIGVTSSSAIIAAGIALVVIGVRDTVVAPPRIVESPSWPRMLLVPVFFPTIFTPALALISIASGAERGLTVGWTASMAGVAVSLGFGMVATRRGLLNGGMVLRAMASVVGLLAVAAGVLVATRGVMSI